MAENINFSGIYYKDILNALQRYRAKNLPELNDFSPYSVESQIERAIALVAHYLNANMDTLAEEMLVPTAKLEQSLVNWAMTIGYPLKAFTPSSVEVVGKLIGHILTQTTVVPKGFQLYGKVEGGSCPFECIEDVVLYDTRQCFIKYWSKTENRFLSSPSVFDATEQDAVYLGFTCMPTLIDFIISDTLNNASFIVKYYDSSLGKWLPVSYQEGYSAPTFSSINNSISFELPQTLSSNWGKTTLDGVEAYYLKLELVSVDEGQKFPEVVSVSLNRNYLYIKFTVYQGITIFDTFTSDGTENQIFNLSSVGLVEGSIDTITINEGGQDFTWSKVNSFANSSSADRHYTVVVNSSGNSILCFGDGVFGRIPPKGSTISVSYRVIDTSVSGKTPPNGISGGVTDYVVMIYNPRQSSSGSTSLYDTEKLRNSLMGWIASNSRVVTHSDLQNYILSNYSSSIERVGTFENKEVNQCIAIVVGVDGEECNSNVIEDITQKLNNKSSGVFLLNQQCVVQNYTQVPFDIDVIVSTKGSVVDIINAILDTFQPCSKDTNGNYIWNFGDIIRVSYVISVIQNVSGVNWVNLISPSRDLPLGLYGLPKISNNNIKIRISSL